MELLIAEPFEHEFITDIQLETQLGTGYLPFSNMNKTGSGVCNYFAKHACHLNNVCPFRHVKGDRTIVCKHWLRGLCKKGDDCEFLHEYDMTKMPECYFFSRFGECMNKECPFLHVDPASKVHDCLWYDRGFCRNGPMCKNRHVRRVACKNFINGFCLEGKNCKFAHPKFLPIPGSDIDTGVRRWICHYCNERGHKIQFCHKLPLEERKKLAEQYRMNHAASAAGHPGGVMPNGALAGVDVTQQPPPTAAVPFQHPFIGGSAVLGSEESVGARNMPHDPKNKVLIAHSSSYGTPVQRQPAVMRSLNEVTCYKCGEKGHYANRCNKGYLAFLSKNAQVVHSQINGANESCEEPMAAKT